MHTGVSSKQQGVKLAIKQGIYEKHHGGCNGLVEEQGGRKALEKQRADWEARSNLDDPARKRHSASLILLTTTPPLGCASRSTRWCTSVGCTVTKLLF